MTITFTTRFGLIQWGASTDGPTRVQFDNAMTQIENLAAMDKQDLIANRPAPAAANQGMYFYATDTGVLYRSTGSTWNVVGGKATDVVDSSSTASTVPLTAAGVAGQTGNLQVWSVAGVTKASIDPSGNMTLNQSNPTRLSAVNDTAASTVISGKGVVSQTGDMLALSDSTSANLFKVQASGAVQSKFFGSASGAGYIGVGSASSVANLTTMSFGTPAFQVESGAGGSGSSFVDGIYLHHAAANTNAVTRRLGLLMRVGDEVAGDASKTGGIYIESGNASFATSDLVLMRGDNVVMRFPGSGDVNVTNNNLTVDKTIKSAVNSGQAQYLIGTGGAAIGLQGSSAYVRTNTNTADLYVYAGGTHSDTPGMPGGTGVTMAIFDAQSFGGILHTNRLQLDGNITPINSSPNLLIGPTSGLNVQGYGQGFQAVNNGAAATLLLQPSGGDITLGTSGTNVNVPGHMTLAHSDYNTLVYSVPNSAIPNNGSGVTANAATIPTTGRWLVIANAIGPSLTGGGAYGVMDLWCAGNTVATASVGGLPVAARLNCSAIVNVSAGADVHIVLASVSQFGGNWNAQMVLQRLP